MWSTLEPNCSCRHMVLASLNPACRNPVELSFLKETFVLQKMTFLVFLALSGIESFANEPTNVILILADDLGWSDTTLFGKTKLYETPNLERLAARGMKFNRAYSNSPLCSPTRASILTGQSVARHGSTAPQSPPGQSRFAT